ncbi:hypothetical protein FDP41_001289 [Naegleria fowleri]|uniref:Uncharacterized protein n=1 Tax=Naegleria fowleri TaxID=5763 RepID=A0A6A5BYL3_NAEFO|nr:uncharacterized protein FDP41_001289 [Naegleria fowleri]KAF0979621.1 hypothetical protein FDP41_001289 [Naegleria fowleri]CAG4714805.1 unnamed protein product [Naegleria fowleri]
MSFIRKLFSSVSDQNNKFADDQDDEAAIQSTTKTQNTSSNNGKSVFSSHNTETFKSTASNEHSRARTNNGEITTSTDEYDNTSRNYDTLTFTDDQLNRDLAENVTEDVASYHRSTISHRSAIPKFPDNKLTDEEKKYVAFCIEKLKKVEGVDSKKIQTIAQNCVLHDRFKYKFFNPATEMDQDIGFGGMGATNKRTKTGLRIKFVLTELDQSSHMRLLRRIGHTLNFTGDSQFGMFHTALIVGNWYVEWNDNSLAIVRKNSSSKAVFAFDLVIITKEADIHHCLDVIAKECCRWNGSVMYENRKANCQHFTQAVLEKIGIDFESKLKGAAKNYIERLKKYGVCDMTIDLTDKLKPLFKNVQSVTFKTHAELDMFYNTIKDALPSYFDVDEGKSDEILLKSFDRAFWLRKESSKASADDEPLRGSDNCCLCPFNQYEDVFKVYLEKNSVNSKYSLGNYLPEIPNR